MVRGTDRHTYGATVAVGSTQNTVIDLGGSDAIGRCQAPIGIAVSDTLGRAYVNCWVTRRLAVVDLGAVLAQCSPPAITRASCRSTAA
jgi:hypothetical protein